MSLTMKRASFQTQQRVADFCGLSTDEKPNKTNTTVPIPNGSLFYEMDTQKKYRYDADSDDWIAQS